MDFIDVLPMLDCDNNLEIQNKGIELAMKIDDIGAFILPMYPLYNKNVWENCAKIIVRKSDQELIHYIGGLLEWLQDLNWPGVFIIIDRLKVFSGSLLVNPYSETVCQALKKSEDDREWVDHLSVLIENEDLTKRLNKNLYEYLKVRYTAFWN